MGRSSGLLAATLIVTTVPFVHVASAQLKSVGPAEARFVAAGPVGFQIIGKTADVAVIDTGTTIVISVPLATLKTGIALRDKHMREKYLQVAQFPVASLTVDRNALKIPKLGAAVDEITPAVLTIHGQTRPVSIHYTAKHDAAAIHVAGFAHIHINDFGIAPPEYLGLRVKPDVDIAVRFDATDA